MKKVNLTILVLCCFVVSIVANQFVAIQGTAAQDYTYHTYNSLVTDLNQLADNHPDIAKVYNVGTSAENREIVVIKISDNAASDTDEQENKVLFIGTHHAREWISLEVPYLLAEHLIENYSDPDIKNLIDNVEIWIIPLLNPDGYEYSRNAERLWRKNRHIYPNLIWPDCNGVDLNRNYGSSTWGTINNSANSLQCVFFGHEWDTYVGPSAFSEPETQAIRDFFQSHRIDAVLSYHSYTQLILWPWGYKPDDIGNAADREFMENLGGEMRDRIYAVYGETYVAKQSYEIYNAAVAGDLTDWSYETYEIPSFTIELRPESETPGFLLPADQIDETFEENLPAALRLLEAYLPTIDNPTTSSPSNAGPYANPHKVFIDVSGIGKGRTISDFTVKIGGINGTVTSAARIGVNKYILGIMPPPQPTNGLYDLEVSMGGSSVLQQDAVNYFHVSNADVALVLDRSGSMGSSGYMEPAKAAARQFVDFMQDGDEIGVVSFSSSASVNFPLTMITGGTPPPPIFEDDMESGSGNWTSDSPWAITTEQANSSTYAWSDSPGGDYSNHTDISLTLNSPLNLTGLTNPTLTFWSWLDLETGYDDAYVEVSTNGGSTWIQVASYTGHNTNWVKQSINLSAYNSQTDLRLRFRLVTDYSVTYDGWYIDDVQFGDGGDTREQAKNAVDQITAGGSTSIGAGLETAQTQLVTSGDPLHPWAIVLLSDGYENVAPYVADVLPDIAASRTVVHTVALGPNSDQNLLLDIASQTSGTYNYAPDSNTLAAIYNAIIGQVTDQQTLFTETGTVNQGQTEQKNVIVDTGLYETTFAVTWSDTNSDIDLTLINPDGVVVDPDVASVDPDVDYYFGDTYEYYRVRNPLAGSWIMQMYGATIPLQTLATTSGQTYTAVVTGRSDTALNFYLDLASYLTGDRVLMTAVVADEQPILGTDVDVVITIPVSQNTPIAPTEQWTQINTDSKTSRSLITSATITQTISLFDDGLHDDGIANDGVYANVFEETSVAGIYSFNLNADGVANDSSAFHRLASTTASINLPPLPTVTVTSSPPMVAEPGDVLITTFQVENTGDSWDTFDLRAGEIETILDWGDTSAIPEFVSLYPGQTVSYDVIVTVPVTASPGSLFVLPLIAVSQTNIDTSDVATIEVDIPIYYTYLSVIHK